MSEITAKYHVIIIFVIFNIHITFYIKYIDVFVMHPRYPFMGFYKLPS